MRPTSLSGSLIAALLLAGCGDDGPTGPVQADCSAVTSCGGDLEGTWRVRGLCTLDHACDGTSYDFAAVTTTITFSTSKVTTAGGGTAKITLPLTCLDASTTCASLNSRPGYTCAEAGTSCSCTVDYSRVNPGIPVMGYLLSSNQLILGGQAYDYCIQNGVLRMQADLPAGAKGNVSEYVKQ